MVGSLCENNDKFAIQRRLPTIEKGDRVVIHDTGAHGHAMGFNYNGQLRPKELLLRTDGTVELIRREERLEDYFATLDFPADCLAAKTDKAVAKMANGSAKIQGHLCAPGCIRGTAHRAMEGQERFIFLSSPASADR